MPGLWRVHWQIRAFTVLSTFYTRHDQASLLWACIAAGIFVMAQFLPLSWMTQAVLSSIFTVIGVTGMVALNWYFAVAERLSWILYCWVGLMVTGMLATDLGVFFGWAPLLMHICPLWLGLSAVGYLVTGLGLRSRLFFLVSLLHLLAIWLLPYVGLWQQLFTGFVISGGVFLIAEVQWDANGVCTYQQQASDSKFTA